MVIYGTVLDPVDSGGTVTFGWRSLCRQFMGQYLERLRASKGVTGKLSVLCPDLYEFKAFVSANPHTFLACRLC